jgi:hypothetical protein
MGSVFDVEHMAASGTASDCDPSGARQRPDIVGQSGGCRLRGFLKFDLTAIGPHTPVLSARLHLWSPDSTARGHVMVFANASPGDGATLEARSWQPVTWAGLPKTKGPGVAESGVHRNWHSWDVTSAVRPWCISALTLHVTGVRSQRTILM